jgi:high-affinity nickel-transport protein
VAQVFSQQMRLSGGFWDYANGFNLNRAGFLIVGIFVGVWVLALGIWRFGRVEERWETSAAAARAERA